MAASNSPAGTTQPTEAAEATAKIMSKRYDALLSVRTKALKGKGAWYWSNLEPLLIHSSDSGLPKSVKLRCTLCNSMFSASNPSRTASEHLKRGNCPNFSPTAVGASSSTPKPISSLPPFKKRSSPSYLALVDSSTAEPTFSSLKQDIPKSSPIPPLPKPLSDTAISLLTDWFLESGPTTSPSSLSHPKFQSFLHQVGLPIISPRRITGPLLDSRFRNLHAGSTARARDAVFFQIDSSGWNDQNSQSLISVAVNLPNGTTVFHRIMLIPVRPPSDYAEEILLTAISNITDEEETTRRCAGIVADRFKSKALRRIETDHKWMVNLHCQLQGFYSLIKDFARDLPLFNSIAANCFKITSFFNSHSSARTLLHKNHLLHSASPSSNLESILTMLEDLITSSQPIQSTAVQKEFNLLCNDDSSAREVSEIVKNVQFWTDLEAVFSLINLIKTMSNEMETERPVVSRCLPLWNELKSKIKEWRSNFNIEDDTVDQILDRRFRKNYHPAWSAGFILDPLYLTKDASGKYLPPFKYLTAEQEKDVDRLITRLVSREEAHIALMELMKWRTEGLDPLYAQAVQVKQFDPLTGKMKVVNPHSSRLVWETCLSGFRVLGKVAVRIIFMRCTAYRVRFGAGVLGMGRGLEEVERVEKMVFVAAHARIERGRFGDVERDPQIFGEEDVSAEVSLV